MKHNNINTLHYNASYSFENDIINEHPLGFTIHDSGGSIKVISNLDKHNEILEMYDNNSGDYVKIRKDFSTSINFGSYEYFIQLNDTNKGLESTLYNNGIPLFSLLIDSGKFQYYDGSWNDIGLNALDNIWYHIRIDFECTNGNYKSLSQYAWQVFINEIDYGNYNFANNEIESTKIEIKSGITHSNYYQYLDSLGLTWLDNYTLGQNLYPYIQEIDSNLISKDKYDFNLDSNNNPYPITGYPEIYGWNKVYSTESHIYLDMDNSENGVQILGELDGCGIKNESLGLYGSKFNITFELIFDDMHELDSYLNFTVISINNITIIELKFDTLANGISSLSYFNGIDYIDLVIISNIDRKDIYFFNLYIYNYTVNLSWFKNNIYNNTYNFDLISNQYSINNISFLIYDDNTNEDYLAIRINSIGIYQYNISLTMENGYLDYDLDRTWTFNEHNLFEFISNELIKIVAYGILDYPTVYYLLREFDNKDYFINLHQIDKFISQCHIWFIAKTSFNPINILFSIEGIKLSEYKDDIFIKDYYPTYIFENVNSNYSYFYVDNYNRLQYKFNISQNGVFEKMVIYFDINIVSTNNRTFIFKGRETSIKVGYKYVRIECIDNFAYNIDLKSYHTVYNTNLFPDNAIHRILLGCLDYNNNNFTGYISKGYIYGLSLRSYVSIQFTIISLYLIGIIISIILIFIPTISFYFVFKKKELIIPMLILMTVISFATSLIPFELFFIMIITLGCGIFLQFTKKRFN